MLDTALFNSDTRLHDYRTEVWRVVESQEDAATLQVVDDLEEQTMLEEMLDKVKPQYRNGTEGMHYLLKTAFRYPPLKWGSRFGTRAMPSYFYASEAKTTALCECAYYRFLFLSHMQAPYLDSIRSEYTVFNVLVASDTCLDLTTADFQRIDAQLTDPSNYGVSQKVGNWVYQQNQNKTNSIDLIRFKSARTPHPTEVTQQAFKTKIKNHGINVAIANPSAIRSPKPRKQERWLCLTKADTVSFSSRESDVSFIYPLSDFSDEGDRLLVVA